MLLDRGPPSMVHQEANRQIWNSDTAHGQGKRHVPL